MPSETVVILWDTCALHEENTELEAQALTEIWSSIPSILCIWNINTWEVTSHNLYFFPQTRESLQNFQSKEKQMWLTKELKYGWKKKFIKNIGLLYALSFANTFKRNDRDSSSSLYWHLLYCVWGKFTYMSLCKVLMLIIFMGKNKHLKDHIFYVMNSVNAHINQIVKAVYSPWLDISSFWHIISKRTRILEAQFYSSLSLSLSSHSFLPIFNFSGKLFVSFAAASEFWSTTLLATSRSYYSSSEILPWVSTKTYKD